MAQTERVKAKGTFRQGGLGRVTRLSGALEMTVKRFQAKIHYL